MSLLADAIRNNMIGLHERLCRTTPQVTFVQTDRLARYESDYPSGLLNRILRYRGIGASDPQAEIAEIVNAYRERGQACYWLSYEDEEDNEIREALAGNQLRVLNHFTGMALSLKAWSYKQLEVPGLVIKEVSSPQEFEDYSEVVLAGFQIPPDIQEGFKRFFIAFGEPNAGHIKHYIGYYEEKPACTLTVYLENGVAGIYSVSTAEDYRNKGIGSAITAYVLRGLQERDADIAVLTASAAGAGVYKRLGFEEQVTVHFYSS